MASSADNSTALSVMTEANSDFLEFIRKLREFLTGKEPVTFNIGGGITVDSLMNLIRDYKNGRFETIILGGQSSGTQVELSVHSDEYGNTYFRVADKSSGNLAYIECEKLTASVLENCHAQNIYVEGATIDSIVGSVAVKGGDITLDSLNLRNLNVDGTLDAKSMRVQNLNVVGSLVSSGMVLMGTRQFAPSFVRSVFYRSSEVLDNAATYLHISSDNEWEMSGEDYLVPKDFGFQDAPATVSPVSAPDLVQFRGNTAYEDFSQNEYMFSFFRNRSVARELPDNVYVVAETLPANTWKRMSLDSTEYEFAAVTAWPTGFGSYSNGSGRLYLTGFNRSDVGKEIYYRTSANPWKIYRRMHVYLANSVSTGESPEKVSFGELLEIPPYSCMRFILNRTATYNRSSDISANDYTVDYILELA